MRCAGGGSTHRLSYFADVAQTGDLGDAIARERAEREERRGVETRATTLLAGSVAIIGLTAAAIKDINYPDAPFWKTVIVGLLALIFIYALLAVQSLVLALRIHDVAAGARPRDDDHEGLIRFFRTKAERISSQNKTALANLEDAIKRFGMAVGLIISALFALILIDALGLSQSDASKPVVVHVVAPRGPAGAPGPPGPRGLRGRRGPRGPASRR